MRKKKRKSKIDMHVRNSHKGLHVKTYPTGRGIAIGPSKSPAPTTFKFDPNSILHWLRKDTVQKGRTKSWLSI
jgi:hypothetical protein